MIRLDVSKPKLPWHAVLCTAVLVLFTVIWSAQSALASDSGLVGRIEAMPPQGLLGEWTVDGFHFVTSGATEFRQERGEFAIGRCVEVEYVTVAEQNLATKVAVKSNDDCQGDDTPTVTPPNVTPTVTPEPTATHDHGDDDGHGDDNGTRVRALVEAMPQGSFRGIWTIGGVQYEVGEQSRVRQQEGPLRVGACVELSYTGAAEPYTLLRMESVRRSKCEHGPGGTIPQPTGTPEGNDGQEIHGILNSFPAELIGEWIIAGKSYTATAETEFDQEHGAFAEGVCVKAHLATDDPTMLREIETTSSFRCGDSDGHGGNAHGNLFGVIQEIPAGLMGDWQIGGTTVTVDAATELKQRGVAFAKDVMVRVHFIVQADGSFYATEIESVYHNDDERDDDHNGVYEGAEGHAYGLIEKLPETGDLIGTWVVAGISYTVTSDTYFVQPHSDFAVDVMVRVKYRIDADGNLVARQIKTTRGNGGASSHDHAVLFGYVKQMPMSGYVGEWIVDGLTFTATTNTKFKEENGVFVIGSYVKVEYYTVDGQNILHEIESEVPPGAGDNTTVGEIEVMEEEGSGSAAVSSAAVGATTWTIGGKQYVVTPATDLNDFQGTLAVGQEAVVNSYTAGDGSQVATQIRGIALNHELFLPTVNR